MFYLRQVTDFLRLKLFPQDDLPSPLIQPHVPLDINQPARRPPRVSQCVVACQVDENELDKNESPNSKSHVSDLDNSTLPMGTYVDRQNKQPVSKSSSLEETQAEVFAAFSEVNQGIDETAQLGFD